MRITFEELDTPTLQANAAADAATITLSPAAAAQIQRILKKASESESNPASAGETHAGFLRLSISGGGCGGYSYTFKVDSAPALTDTPIPYEGSSTPLLYIPAESLSYLKNAIIDFEETIEASQFIVRNPNAKSSCGCGSSFSL